VVVLSYDYWRNHLGGRSDIVGRGVSINTHPMTVIGVAPADFRGIDLGEVPSLWVPTVIRALLAFLPQNIAAVDLRATIEPLVFAFALGASSIVGVLFSLAAAVDLRATIEPLVFARSPPTGLMRARSERALVRPHHRRCNA